VLTELLEGSLEVCDQHFAIAATGDFLSGVKEVDLPESELLENSMHFRNVVQGEDEFGFQARKALCHLFEVRCGEIVAIETQAEIGRVEVEEGIWPIESLEHFFIREVFNLHPREALVRRFDDFREALRIQSRRLRNMALVVQTADQSSVAVLQEIQVASRALDIGEQCRIGRLEQFVPSAAHKHEAKIAKQFLIMLLADAEEVHHLAIEVIQYFDFGRVFAEEHLRPSSERLDVCRVFRKDVDDLLRNRALAADVRQRSDHVWWNEFLALLNDRFGSTFIIFRSVVSSYANGCK
jgi:hypothetical protein